MDKDQVAGSAKKIKGSIKEVVGKTAGNAKLEAEGKADKVEGKVQNAVGGLKDKATSQRKTSQRVSQSASPLSHTRLAKPSRSRRSSDGVYHRDGFDLRYFAACRSRAPATAALWRLGRPCSDVSVTFGQLKPSKAGTKTI